MKKSPWQTWLDLRNDVSDADARAWAKAAALWPEVASGDTDPLLTAAYRNVVNLFAVHWAVLNHPDRSFRKAAPSLVVEWDPFFATRGMPPESEAMPRSVKDWRASSADLRARVEATVDVILEELFAALREAHPKAGRRPVDEETVARYRPCILSFFVHWLSWNHPDTAAIEALLDEYVRLDPLFTERCGADPRMPP